MLKCLEKIIKKFHINFSGGFNIRNFAMESEKERHETEKCSENFIHWF